MLLEGGLDWKQLSLSPKDMDFVEAKNAAAREIALALGVPPMLLGIPGDNTYSNYQEASRSFWRQTVLPLVNRTAKAMSMWLSPAWGGGLELRPDLDAIEALSGERDQLWARLEKASFLTDDEKRAAAGYGPKAEGGGSANGLAAKYSADQPRVPAGSSDGGQWTSGGGGGAVLSDSLPDALWTPGSVLAQATDRQQGYNVDLATNDRNLGGHTLRDHVGKSDQELLDYVVRRRTLNFYILKVGQDAEGSFVSQEAANDLVNRTLERFPDEVAAIASGTDSEAVLNTRFGYVTGKEAFRPDPDSDPYMRPTYAVRVVIQHDKRSPADYRVFTAFPRNQRPGEAQ